MGVHAVRFFKIPSDENYESLRLQLDAAWGHPKTGAETCVSQAAIAPRNQAGQILLAVHPEFCEYPAVYSILPALLESGTVVEITYEQYFDSPSDSQLSLVQQPSESPSPVS
jgi:hypothetical protein